jgi:glyoxylase-like metal-dependent hydrolase (beta-lactamase superfamily II)
MKNGLKARLALGVAVVAAWSGAYLHGQFGDQPAKLDTIRIANDLYVIHNDFVPGNTTALITSEGVVLVDDKFEIDHEGVMAALKKITDQPVKYVINTHHHPDHSGGNAKLQKLNVIAVASEEARENMVEGNLSGLPSMTFERHAHLYLGGKNIELYHFGRAHTNGDVVVLFPERRTLAMGDMFTFGDATPQLVDYAGGGSAKEWTKTLDDVLQLDFDTVVPGHGTVTNKQEVRRFRARTVALRNRVHDFIVQKKTRDDLVAMLRKEFHWTDFHVQSLDGLMAELR